MPIYSRLYSKSQRRAQPSPSLIKPYLRQLSGSGSTLDGVVVERIIDAPLLGIESAPPASPQHLLILPLEHSATLTWRMDGRWKQTTLSNGASILNPAGFFTRPRWHTPTERLMVAIAPIVADKISETLGLNGTVNLEPRYPFRDELLNQLARSLLTEFEQDTPPDVLYAESLANMLVVHLIKTYSASHLRPHTIPRSISQQRLSRVVEFIHANLNHTLSLRQLADIAEISPSHFTVLFRQATGTSPHQYLLTQRIKKAKELLRLTNTPIADIASQTGFADQSHLTRLIRRYTGHTPKDIRGL